MSLLHHVLIHLDFDPLISISSYPKTLSMPSLTISSGTFNLGCWVGDSIILDLA